MVLKMNKIISILLLVLISTISVKGQLFSTKTGNVEFLSEATVESFTGKSNAVTGEINVSENTIDFYVDLNTVTTGIKLRDEHMRENHLNTEEFPFAEFTGILVGFDSSVKDTQLVVAKGDFTIRGKAKAMEIHGKVISNGNTLYIKANWEVKLADHEIPLPKFLFLKLSEVQKVSLSAVLNRQ